MWLYNYVVLDNCIMFLYFNEYILDVKKQSFSSEFSAPEILKNHQPKQYEAMYNFDARNPDEISFTVGQIIWVGFYLYNYITNII